MASSAARVILPTEGFRVFQLLLQSQLLLRLLAARDANDGDGGVYRVRHACSSEKRRYSVQAPMLQATATYTILRKIAMIRYSTHYPVFALWDEHDWWCAHADPEAF
jgi:hypothetical protein